MRKGKIKNSIVTIAMAMMLSVTAVVGFGTNAKAAAGNTGNKQYSYSNIDPIGSCEWRTKNNATKVYVYPTAGPKIYYEANGRKKNSITGQYEKIAGSYSYAIPTGTQGSITNWINEKGGTEARLVMSRISYSRLDTSGVWSPDSTRNYTIFG